MPGVCPPNSIGMKCFLRFIENDYMIIKGHFFYLIYTKRRKLTLINYKNLRIFFRFYQFIHNTEEKYQIGISPDENEYAEKVDKLFRQIGSFLFMSLHK